MERKLLPVSQSREGSLSPAGAAVGGDVLVHLQHGVDQYHEDDHEDDHEDGKEGDLEDKESGWS